MSIGDNAQSGQLDVGSVLRRGEALFIVERGPTEAGDVVIKELGNRRNIKPDRVPDFGDDCPNPVCEGVVEDWGYLGKRFCSEGCLEWLTCFMDDGQDCDKHSSRDCDGTIVHEDAPTDKYQYTCTDCDRRGTGVKRWREAWWPHAKKQTLEQMRSNNDGGDFHANG